MKVMIVRHGFAGEYSGDPVKDNDRSLKGEGILAVKALADWLSDSEITPNVIYSSPIKRCMQTAKIISDTLGCQVEPVEALTLRSHGMDQFIAKLADRGEKRPMLVSHRETITPAMEKLDPDHEPFDAMAMAEFRVFKVDRDDYSWDEKKSLRRIPSDLNEDAVDYYTGNIDLPEKSG